jgi:pimeloyl-ACP methyl ester carboxylesterase
MNLIEVDGLRIAYERAGQGPSLILLHGYVADGPTTWRRQIDGLSDEFTVVAWDAPGAGRSSDPPESFGMAGYADCLAGFVETLGLRRPHVVGLSFGGALALELYRRHSALPATLVLASAYAGWAGSLPAEIAAQRLQQALVLADLTPDESSVRCCRRCSPKAHRRSLSMHSARACWHSIQLASGQWRVRPPRTSAAYCPR